MLYLNAINSEAGIAVIKDGSELCILTWPYNASTKISKNDYENLLKSSKWIEYKYKKNFNSLIDVKKFIINEFFVNFFINISKLEKDAYKGVANKDPLSLRIDKIIAHIQKLQKASKIDVNTINICSGLPIVYALEESQIDKILYIKNKYKEIRPSISILPFFENVFDEKFDFKSFYNHVSYTLEKQGRVDSVMLILKYMMSDPFTFVEGDFIKAEYVRYREMSAEKRGYSTSLSFKKKEKKIKKTIRRK